MKTPIKYSTPTILGWIDGRADLGQNRFAALAKALRQSPQYHTFYEEDHKPLFRVVAVHYRAGRSLAMRTHFLQPRNGQNKIVYPQHSGELAR